MQIEGCPAIAHPGVRAIGLLFPGLLIVPQGKGKRLVDDTLFERLVIDRERDFDAAE